MKKTECMGRGEGQGRRRRAPTLDPCSHAAHLEVAKQQLLLCHCQPQQAVEEAGHVLLVLQSGAERVQAARGSSWDVQRRGWYGMSNPRPSQRRNNSTPAAPPASPSPPAPYMCSASCSAVQRSASPLPGVGTDVPQVGRGCALPHCHSTVQHAALHH
jgi:hypothetical protein